MTSQPSGPERGDPSDAELVAGESERRDDDAEVAERVQVELAATPWLEVLAGSVGGTVELVISDGVRHRGIVAEVGDGWCLLEVGGRSVLLPLGQVVALSGLRGQALRACARPGMGSVLRRWGRMRCVVTAHLVDGSTRSGPVVDVLVDAFALAAAGGPGGLLIVPHSGVRWLVGDLFTPDH
ncbi:MAG: hypothetical protein LH645_11000 [Actinomycetia bacterium]|nr:hypothetical protein [Actinomycetes bacterium]